MNRIVALCLIALSAAACATAPDASFEDDLALDVDDPAGKEDGVIRPIGTFNVAQAESVREGLLELTLYSDKTFHLSSRAQARCGFGPSPCPHFDSSIVGTYRYTKSGRNRYIRLASEQFLQYDRFRYTYQASDGALRVTPIHEGNAGDAYQLTRDDAGGTCGETAQCGLLDLDMTLCSVNGEPAEQLESAWTCIDNSCVPACLLDVPGAN